ncbi:MAG: hypothetical protein K1X35_12395 [Caulobacteraceae bacterium]|nr:hypothetical protein [Caulobacteraceae bacterium]
MTGEPPPRSRERYLRQAEQAADLARRAATEQEREAFEDIARLWRKLAGQPGDDNA